MNHLNKLHFRFALTLVPAVVCALAQATSAEANLTYTPATKNPGGDAFWKPMPDRNHAISIPRSQLRRER